MIDYPYIFLYIFIFALLGVANKFRYRYIFFLACIVLVLFYSLRAPIIGADTRNYVEYFLEKQISYNNNDARGTEPLLDVYNSIVRFICKNGTFYLLINTLCCLLPVFLIIQKYSENKILSLILLMISSLFIIYFVALRQMLSTSILLCGLMWVECTKYKKTYKWLIWGFIILLAYFMHTTALVVGFILSILMLDSIEVNKKIVYVLILVSLLVGIILKNNAFILVFTFIFNLGIGAVDRLSDYAIFGEDDNTSFAFLTLIVPNLMSLAYVYASDKHYLNSFWSKTYLVYVMLHNIFMYFPMIERMTAFFLIGQILVFTYPLKLRLTIKKRIIYKSALFIFIAYFLARSVKTSINYDRTSLDKMHPYYFFFEKYPKNY